MSLTPTVAPVTPPPDTGPRLDQHLNTLVSREARAFVLGSRIIDEQRSEAAVVRHLLDAMIKAWRDDDPADYARRVAVGEAELVRRDAAQTSDPGAPAA